MRSRESLEPSSIRASVQVLVRDEPHRNTPAVHLRETLVRHSYVDATGTADVDRGPPEVLYSPMLRSHVHASASTATWPVS